MQSSGHQNQDSYHQIISEREFSLQEKDLDSNF